MEIMDRGCNERVEFFKQQVEFFKQQALDREAEVKDLRAQLTSAQIAAVKLQSERDVASSEAVRIREAYEGRGRMAEEAQQHVKKMTEERTALELKVDKLKVNWTGGFSPLLEVN
jgi:chromosome segregation ATPase